MRKLLAVVGVALVLGITATVAQGWKWTPFTRAAVASPEITVMTGWTWDSADPGVEGDAGA
jgi:hypothetical protein